MKHGVTSKRHSAILIAFHGFGLPLPEEYTISSLLLHLSSVLGIPLRNVKELITDRKASKFSKASKSLQQEDVSKLWITYIKHLLEYFQKDDEGSTIKCECPEDACPLFNLRMFAHAPCLHESLKCMMEHDDPKCKSLAIKLIWSLYIVSCASGTCKRSINFFDVIHIVQPTE